MKMKIFVSILLLIIVACMIASPVLGVNIPWNEVKPSQPGNEEAAIIQAPALRMLGYIQFIGVFVAIGVAMVFGVKYIMASAQEKADLKGKALFLVIGILLLAFAPTIVKVVYTAASGMNS